MVAIGGGSAIDLAKAAGGAGHQRAGGSVLDYLEGVGRGLQITAPAVPLLAMPTTGGTGSEATKNAVISSYDPPFKKSLRSDLMVPRAVLIDPELTVCVPPVVTAAMWHGRDHAVHRKLRLAARPGRSLGHSRSTDCAARCRPSSRRCDEPANRAAREAMAHAALLSGMALANSGLGLAHGVAAALGVHARTRHGLACAVMLPVALARQPPALPSASWPSLPARFGMTSWPSDAAAADALVARIDALCRA